MLTRPSFITEPGTFAPRRGDAFFGLNVNDEAIGARIFYWRAAKKLEGRFAKLDGDFRDAFGEALSRSEVEGNIGPAPVVDAEVKGDERFGVRVRGELRFVAIRSEFFAVYVAFTILAANHGLQDGFGRGRRDGVKNFRLLVTDGVGFEGEIGRAHV